MKKLKTRDEWLAEGHSYDNEIEKARMMQGSASELVQWAERKIAESRPENFKEGVIQPVRERRSSYDKHDGPIITDIKDALKKGKVNVGGMVEVGVDSNNKELPKGQYAIMPFTNDGDYWNASDLKKHADSVIDDLNKNLKADVELISVDTGKSIRSYIIAVNESLNEAKDSYKIMRFVDGRTKEMIEGTISEIMDQFSSAIDKLRGSGSGKQYKDDPKTIEELVHYLNAAQQYIEKKDNPKNTYAVHESKVNERMKPLRKKHWDKADDDQRYEWLLQAFKDPDDAEQYVEYEWNDLPPDATQNMYESVNEAAKDLRFKYVIGKDFKNHGVVDFVKGDKVYVEIDSDGNTVPYSSSDVYVLDDDDVETLQNAMMKGKLKPGADSKDIKSFAKKHLSINEAKDPVYKKGQKINYQLYFQGGVGKYADAISKSKDVDTGVIRKRTKNKITGSFKYELTNGLELSSDEIVGLAESEVNESLKGKLKALYKAAQKKFGKTKIVPPNDADYASADKFIEMEYGKGYSLFSIGVDKIQDLIYIEVGHDKDRNTEDIVIDRPASNANESVTEADWSDDVKTKWTPPSGLFTEPANKIADVLHKESDDLDQAMSRLMFYINRGGKLLDAKAKANLETAKKLLQQKYA